MKKTYEVTGHYPAFRPKPIGETVQLLEEEARYPVLDGVLKEVAAPAADEPATKRKGGER
jgi:hypothetical protein